METRLNWTIAGGRVLRPAPFLLAGIVNVTPDSFYDGNQHSGLAEAVSHGLLLRDQGAHILDIGGESTRPYADKVSEAEEIDRVVPVVEALSAALTMEEDTETVISVDTYKAEVARQALEAGATIVNDVSAFAFDEALLDVVTQFQPGYVLMHSLGRPEEMQNDPKYDNVVDELLAFFEQKMEILTSKGLSEDNIVIDPGVGFGKLLEHNLKILNNIDKFKVLGRPVYMGLSNKSLFGQLLGLEPNARQTATQVATALLAARGVQIHRVHEVEKSMQSLKLVEEISL